MAGAGIGGSAFLSFKTWAVHINSLAGVRYAHECIAEHALALAGVVAMGLSAATANAASFLWISAPNWSYSAAAAESPVGFAYFWGLSAGAGTYLFAYAFSNGGGGAAYAFAEASAGGPGGMGGVQVAGWLIPMRA